MKYARLTKEQFEELHPEFTRFLATQSIDAKEWKEMKLNKPGIAEELLDVFSDLIWEGVLNKVGYIENWSKHQVFLFCFQEEQADLITLRTSYRGIDFNKKSGFLWLKENIMSNQVEIFKASRPYTVDKNKDKFEYIKQGAVITKGELYESVHKVIS